MQVNVFGVDVGDDRCGPRQMLDSGPDSVSIGSRSLALAFYVRQKYASQVLILM
jgi:hypothetical protein